MRTLLDTFVQTMRTLWAHKLRSFLTMFGIAWGVGSLLLLVGVGEGFRNGNRKQLETFGKNIIFFFGGRQPAVEVRGTFAVNPRLRRTPATDIPPRRTLRAVPELRLFGR